MNYIRELNAFHRLLLYGEGMPPAAINLWRALLSIDNETGWKKRFNAPACTFMQLTGLSKQGMANARKVLVERG